MRAPPLSRALITPCPFLGTLRKVRNEISRLMRIIVQGQCCRIGGPPYRGPPVNPFLGQVDPGPPFLGLIDLGGPPILGQVDSP